LVRESSLSQEGPALKKGLVQVYTGDGKGKTSAALGSVLRAAGAGLRVYIVFFMKGDFVYSENHSLTWLPGVAMVKYGGRGFVDPADIRLEDREQAGLAIEAAREAMLSGRYDLVVLDEVNVAAAWGLIPLNEVIGMVKAKPENVEIILTGRYADPSLIKLADLVTEMNKIKHPFDEGTTARRGIEY
jgi:cob(I)alamin adenosyltransferase